jgi:hypothetical protein
MLDGTPSDLRSGSNEVDADMAAYWQITTGYWATIAIGVVLPLMFVAGTTVSVMRGYRRPRKETVRESAAGLSDALPSDMSASLRRCRVLIAEALIVRQRLSGEIDAET